MTRRKLADAIYCDICKAQLGEIRYWIYACDKCGKKYANRDDPGGFGGAEE